MSIDRATLAETATLSMSAPDGLTKRQAIALARSYGAVCLEGHARVDKFHADQDPHRATPYEVIEAENLLLTAGATVLFNRLTGSGTAFDATNTRLAVGNGTTAVAVGQTDLQGGSLFRKVVDSAPAVSTNTCQFVATFLTTEANFAWQEAGVANSASGATLLDRFLQSFGTKTSSLQWTLTITLTAT